MTYRDGSLSTFPTTVDNFTLAVPIGANGVVVPESLEISSNVNKLFDAALNIEKYLLSIANIPLVGILPVVSGSVITASYARRLIFQQIKQSVSLTSWASGGITLNLTVPTSAFGSNPFADPSFAVIITPTLTSTSFNPSNQPISNQSNYTLNGNDTASNYPLGSYNQLIQMPIIYTGIVPALATGGTGGGYTVYINIVNNQFIQAYISGNYVEDWTRKSDSQYFNPSYSLWYSYTSSLAASGILNLESTYLGSGFTPTAGNSLAFNDHRISNDFSYLQYLGGVIPMDQEMEFQVDFVQQPSTTATGTVLVQLNTNAQWNYLTTPVSGGWLADRIHVSPASPYTITESNGLTIKYEGYYNIFNSYSTDRLNSFTTSATINTTGLSTAKVPVLNPAPQFVYQSGYEITYTDANGGGWQHAGGYSFSGFDPSKTYMLTVYLCELQYTSATIGTNLREFGIYINNVRRIYRINPYSQHGAKSGFNITLYAKPDSNGRITISFGVDSALDSPTGRASNKGPLVCGLSITDFAQSRSWGGPVLRASHYIDSSSNLVLNTGIMMQIGSASGSVSATSTDASASYYSLVALFNYRPDYPSTDPIYWSAQDQGNFVCHLSDNNPLKTVANDGANYRYKFSVVGTVVTVYISSNSGATWSVDKTVDYQPIVDTYIPSNGLALSTYLSGAHTFGSSNLHYTPAFLNISPPDFSKNATFRFLPTRLSASPYNGNSPSVGIDLNIMYTKIGTSVQYTSVNRWPRSGWSN